MRRSKVAILIFAGLVVIAALVLGLYFGLAQGPRRPAEGPSDDLDEPLDAKEMARLCANAGVTAARCEQLVGEYGMEGTASKFSKDLRTCRQNSDPATVESCILDNLKRSSPFESVFDGAKGSAVYPQNYASLTLSVDSLDLARGPSDELALVASEEPLVMRFVLEGARHSIRTADGEKAVYVATNGLLSIGDFKTVARALFDVSGTGSRNTIHVAPVERRDSKLWYAPAPAPAASSSAPHVTMRLDRRNGLAVDVALDANWLASSEYWHRAFVTVRNNASCCTKLINGCSMQDKQQFPLCCSVCDDTTTECEWKARVDAGVDATACCFSWSTLRNEAIDYNSCRVGSARYDPAPPRPLQYALKCDPTPEHTFAFVPAGVWDLAPRGVRLPAYGRVAQMRIAGAGFRGVRCAM